MQKRIDSNNFCFSKIIKKIILIFIIFLVIGKVNSSQIINNAKNYISLPFSVENQISIGQNGEYISDNFMRDKFIKKLITNMKIGESMQNVTFLMGTDFPCFELTNNYIFLEEKSINKFSPKESPSFRIEIKELKNQKKIIEGTDFFDLNREDLYELTFSITNETNKENKFLGKIGLNTFYTAKVEETCPNFIISLKKKDIIKKYVWSLIYTDKDQGKLFIGDELDFYDNNKYNSDHYIRVYTTQNLEFSASKIFISLFEDSIIDLYYFPVYIKINLGVIIGPSCYKEQMDKIFFNKQIESGTCKVDIVNYPDSNGNQKEYYIYSCEEKRFKEHISILDSQYGGFPNLVFSSKHYNYNFTLSDLELFYLISGRYYFLIIFETNFPKEEKWILGEPFYKRYTFTFDSDAKTIGFYNPYFEVENHNIKEIENNNNNKENDKVIGEKNVTKNEKNNKIWKIIKIIGIIFLCCGLLFLSFLLGGLIKKGRKKKANELKEDDYEYIPENKEPNNNLRIN